MSKSQPDPGLLPPLLIDAKQVAKLLGVSDKTVRRMKDAGELPRPKKIRSRILWRYADIRKFAERP